MMVVISQGKEARFLGKKSGNEYDLRKLGLTTNLYLRFRVLRALHEELLMVFPPHGNSSLGNNEDFGTLHGIKCHLGCIRLNCALSSPSPLPTFTC